MTDPALDQIDPLNFAVVRLEPFFNDTKLGNATGFFFVGMLDGKPNHWLVTNWHVLAGRNAEDPNKILHSQGALPNRLRLWLVIRPGQPEYAARPGASVLMQEQAIMLYDNDDKAMWYQHKNRNYLDVAVMNPGPAFERFKIAGINELAMQNDMAIQIGNGVFILGYPLGFSHFINTPIWKRERWPASSGQIFALDKWSLCRLPLWCAVVGAARREGVARPE